MTRFLTSMTVLLVLFVSQVNAQNIEKLHSRHVEILKKIEAYEKELDRIKSPGTSLTTYKALATKTWNLKAKLERLNKEIETLFQSMKKLPKNLNAHQISVHLNDYDAKTLIRPVANGEIIAFKSKIQTIGSEHAPHIGNLAWQLYGPDGQAISGVNKTSQISEKGQVEEARFRIKVQNMKNGQYTVALIHEIASNPNINSVAKATFILEQPMSINRVVVAKNTTAKKHQTLLMSGDAPHGYVYFKLASSIPKVSVVMKMIEKDSGKVLTEQAVERDRENDGNEQRVGIRLDSSLAKTNKTIQFIATLTSNEGIKLEDSAEFTMKPYRLSMSTPMSIRSGERKKFRVNLPANFKAPYRIIDKTNKNLNINIDKNLNGVISGTTDSKQLTSRFRVTVMDAEGREAYGKGQILIQPKIKDFKTAKSIKKIKKNDVNLNRNIPGHDVFRSTNDKIKKQESDYEKIKKNNDMITKQNETKKNQQKKDLKKTKVQLGRQLWNQYIKEAYTQITIPCYRYNYPLDFNNIPSPDDNAFLKLANAGELNAKTILMKEWFTAYDQIAYTLKYDSCNDKFVKHLANIGVAYRWSSIPTTQMLYQSYISKIRQNGLSNESIVHKKSQTQSQNKTEKDETVPVITGSILWGRCACYMNGRAYYEKNHEKFSSNDIALVPHKYCEQDLDKPMAQTPWYAGYYDKASHSTQLNDKYKFCKDL